MARLSLQHVLLASTMCPLGHGQTIVGQDGRVIGATEATVAPVADSGTLQLTDAVLANLTAHQLSGIELFGFGDQGLSARAKPIPVGSCKVFPGDAAWPSRATWAVFNLLTGGALIKTVPIGAVCYPDSGVYDAGKCANIIDTWSLPATHSNDPTSVMSPLYTGETCMPQNGNTTACTLGGYPSYAINVTTIADIQLAVNLARNANLRLVVKNTGHDFLGKSCGAGALSIWTHHLKSIRFLPEVTTPSYSGPAFKLGAGVNVAELYAAADRHGVTAIGGECEGVGVAGGYIAGGGHSPLSPRYGLGSDQVLSVDVVLPSGRFVTATETDHTDLFFALRGGGGATFGVVTSVTVKAHPKTPFSGLTFTITTGPDSPNLDESVFWAALTAYWRRLPEFAAAGSYGYSQIFPRGPPGSGYTWTMQPWLIASLPLADFKSLLQPLFTEWTAFNLTFTPLYLSHPDFYSTWTAPGVFPTEAVAVHNVRTASRLFPRALWSNTTSRDALFAAVRSVIQEGSALIQYNMNPAAPAGTPPSGANTHWRDAIWFAIMGSVWADGISPQEMESTQRRITDDWMGRLRGFGPGGYLNEGDVMEPGFGEAFFGGNYARLVGVKRTVDPRDVFWAPTAVGSERWEVQGQEGWLRLQTGRLCKVRE